MKKIKLLIVLFLLHQLIFAQENPNPQVLNFFLDCDQCDFNYIRDELPFVSFVRQPQSADIHILVTTSRTGSGGQKYFINFIGMKDLANNTNQYEVVVPQSATEDQIRKSLLKIFKVGILAYFSRTTFIDNLNIDIEETGNRKAESLVTDRWKKWVFRLSSGGEFQKEESQNEYSIETEFSASKITEQWKTRLSAVYELNRENFHDGEEVITNQQDSKEISGQIVKSINEKWSSAVLGGYESRTFLNIRHNTSIGAGIQYNFFPWKECNRRVFSIGYLVGVDSYEYNEITVYDKLKESRAAEMLLIELGFVQPWGEVNVLLQGRNYFNDFSKNRLTVESDFEVRLSKNISAFSNIEAQLVHDQLYLPKGDASLEDILLRRRKLATTYEIQGHIGIRFTFGSIFNNVVNERFDID